MPGMYCRKRPARFCILRGALRCIKYYMYYGLEFVAMIYELSLVEDKIVES